MTLPLKCLERVQLWVDQPAPGDRVGCIDRQLIGTIDRRGGRGEHLADPVGSERSDRECERRPDRSAAPRRDRL